MSPSRRTGSDRKRAEAIAQDGGATGLVCASRCRIAAAHVHHPGRPRAEECRRRAEQAPTENVRKLSLKMAEQLAWYARPDAVLPPPMYIIRADLELRNVAVAPNRLRRKTCGSYRSRWRSNWPGMRVPMPYCRRPCTSSGQT